MPPKRKAAEAAASKSSGAAKKTKVDKLGGLTQKAFLANASELKAVVAHAEGSSDPLVELAVKPGSMQTKSFGWKGNGKVTIPVTIDGETKDVEAQISLNITVIGSKALAENGDAKEEEEKEDKEDDE